MKVSKIFNDQNHQPDAETERLYGYIPEIHFFELYRDMFQDEDFIRCYGVSLSDEKIKTILKKDVAYWQQHKFGSYVWFDKKTQEFVGEGGLHHNIVEGREEIELTYSLNKKHWGKGFAVEIGRFALDQAFNQLDLAYVLCFTLPANHQSLSVMRKLNFQYEKDFIHADLPHKLYRLEKT